MWIGSGSTSRRTTGRVAAESRRVAEEFNLKSKLKRVDWLYMAENRCRAGRRFKTLCEMEEYTKGALNSDWVRSRFPNAPTEIKISPSTRKNKSSYVRDSKMIFIWKTMRDQRTLLHELAHVLIGPDAGHNSEFARLRLDVALQFMGQEAHDELLDQFRIARVPHRPPSERAKKTRVTRSLELYLRESVRRWAREVKGGDVHVYVQLSPVAHNSYKAVESIEDHPFLPQGGDWEITIKVAAELLKMLGALDSTTIKHQTE
jgi:putative metallohydrolase (TIGR04338 family)